MPPYYPLVFRTNGITGQSYYIPRIILLLKSLLVLLHTCNKFSYIKQDRWYTSFAETHKLSNVIYCNCFDKFCHVFFGRHIQDELSQFPPISTVKLPPFRAAREFDRNTIRHHCQFDVIANFGMHLPVINMITSCCSCHKYPYTCPEILYFQSAVDAVRTGRLTVTKDLPRSRE